jgi:hypothetical protein
VNKGDLGLPDSLQPAFGSQHVAQLAAIAGQWLGQKIHPKPSQKYKRKEKRKTAVHDADIVGPPIRDSMCFTTER